MESPEEHSFLRTLIFKIKRRGLRFYILTISLFLLVISSAAIISLTYHKQSKAIHESSANTIEIISSVIMERVTSLMRELEELPKVTRGILIKEHLPIHENEGLTFYLFNAIKSVSNLSALYIATPNGNFIGATDILALNTNQYQEDLAAPAPTGTAYYLRTVDHTKVPPVDMVQFKDADLQTISTKAIDDVKYDPRIRPWYIGAKKVGTTYWTGVYNHYFSSELMITASEPIYDSEGSLIAVIGADLPLTRFSDFMSKQGIGKSGKAFILDSSGTVILPPISNAPSVKISSEMIADIYAQFLQRNQKDFFFESDGVKYLVSIQKVIDALENGWMLLIIDPLADFFSAALQTQKEAVLASCLILIFSAALVIFFSDKVSIPIVHLAKETNKIMHLELDSKTRIHSNIKEIHLMDSSIFAMRNAMRSFVKYMPKEVVKRLIEKNQEITVGGEKKEITIFFSDITGFTHLAESLSAEVIMTLLSEYYDVMSKMILSHKGTIDKYTGDGLMAFWGAPQDLVEHASEACISALLCQTQISQLNASFQKQGKPTLKTRIGINTGTAIVGNVGTSERMNYTAIGDVVNIAARLQPLNKMYQTQILISEKVKDRIGDQFVVRPIDIAEVRGKTEKIKIYELLALLSGDPSILATPEQIDLCTAFKKAFEAFCLEDFKKARVLFQAIHQRFPEDFPTQMYLERLQNYRA